MCHKVGGIYLVCGKVCCLEDATFLGCDAASYSIIIIIISFMQLGHLLTRSGLTYPEVSSKVYHDSFCQSDSSISLPCVIYFEAFYLHVVSSFSCIPVVCPKLVLLLTALQFVHFFCNLSKCILLFYSHIPEERHHQLRRCLLSCKEGVRSMDLVRYSLWACLCHKTNILTASGNKRNCLADHMPACATLSTPINSPPRLICNLFFSSAIFVIVPPDLFEYKRTCE